MVIRASCDTAFLRATGPGRSSRQPCEYQKYACDVAAQLNSREQWNEDRNQGVYLQFDAFSVLDGHADFIAAPVFCRHS